MCVDDDCLVKQLRQIQINTNSPNLIQHQGCIANALQYNYIGQFIFELLLLSEATYE